jgi:prefoldin subunit 5
MPERLKTLEERIDKLIRYIELLDQNLAELREQVETRRNIDRVEKIIHNLSNTFKCRNKNEHHD